MPKGKLSVILMTVVACAVFCTVSPSLPSRYISIGECSSAESVVRYDGKTYVIGYLDSGYAVRKMLNETRCQKVDGIYLLEMDDRAVDNVLDLRDYVDIGTVYCTEFGTSGARFIDNGIDFRLIEAEQRYAASPVYFGGEHIGYEIGGVLFAKNGTDDFVFSEYRAVRIKSADFTDYSGALLCNYFSGDEAPKNMLTIANGGYSYVLA